MAPCRRRLPALALLCLLAAGLAAAQVVANRRRTSQVVEGGLRVHRVESAAMGGMRVGAALDVDTRTNAARAELILAGDGPWDAARLDDAIKGAGALGGLALLLEPAVDESPFLPGLYLAQGRLLGWPARGPVLVITPEGRHVFLAPEAATPEPDAGRVELSTGDPVSISSLNGPPVAGTATLLSGPTTGGIAEAAFFEAGSLVVALDPVSSNTDPGRALWDESRPDDQRAFVTSPADPMRDAPLSAGGLGLVFAPSMAAEAARVAAAGSVVLTLPVGTDVALAEVALHVDGPVMAATPDPQGEDDPALRPVDESGPEVFLAVDGTGRRLFLVESGGGERGRFPMGDELLVWLGEAGAAQVARVGAGGGRFIHDVRESTVALQAGATRARLVLAARVARPALTLPGGGELERLRPGRVTGSNRNMGRNGPVALNDGIFSPSPGLDGHWAAPLPEGASLPLPGTRAASVALQWAEFSFPQPVTVHAVELLHAELAGFSPQFNLKGWRLLARDAPNEPWLLLLTATSDAPQARERRVLEAPRTAREWRLEVLEPSHAEGGEVARLAEVVFWGSESLIRQPMQ